jgi:AraC-like DNA-binding protein
MAIKRSASAEWQGTGKEGKGTLTSQSGVLATTPYGFNTRFGDVKGTNPEELIAERRMRAALRWHWRSRFPMRASRLRC